MKHCRATSAAQGGPWRPYAGPVPAAPCGPPRWATPDAKVRRGALGVLDHAADDESTDVFRVGRICVQDVVTDVLPVLRHDASTRVRHAAIDVLAHLRTHDERIEVALRAAARDDPDPFVRTAADGAARGERRTWTRKAVRRRLRSAGA